MNLGVSGVSMVMVVAERVEGEVEMAGRPVFDVVPAPVFENVYADQFLPLVRLATLMCGRVEVARDIVQDAFVALHLRWATVDQPVAYVRRSVVNGCRSHARWESRRRGRASNVETSIDAEFTELHDVLGRLPHRQRAALVLRFYEGRTEAEIAEILRCRPGTVGPLISRGLQAMRRELSTTEGTS